jgi:hypothetical protein
MCCLPGSPPPYLDALHPCLFANAACPTPNPSLAGGVCAASLSPAHSAFGWACLDLGFVLLVSAHAREGAAYASLCDQLALFGDTARDWS